mmetsp:Transcript_11561/g.28715  ORF Transcript_11561/g.28715 Transcript_11561/m.28715 type:complete len:370 (-) Transcript_11561:470-1579(-)|eukprot:CAMPEP_0115448158 /NCGR_PEP_ID=MMETSP0271-20121206/40344_1 /TAXON_ID=71861 /ORGANISM="Scrippsiella trochoidea, Strain CCMP3099" /LENGTH=369 /DNA_ID=CAMNT_0002874265 /DNA_START=42 /DNA_END=1151 /DNA_ORIENTATION=+
MALPIAFEDEIIAIGAQSEIEQQRQQQQQLGQQDEQHELLDQLGQVNQIDQQQLQLHQHQQQWQQSENSGQLDLQGEQQQQQQQQWLEYREQREQLRTLAPLPPPAPTLSAPRWQMSTWRMPRSPGKLPDYVQRSFRLKAFGLVTLQLVVIFTIMLSLNAAEIRRMHPVNSEVVLCTAVALNVLFLILLVRRINLYPFNYILLAATAVLCGIASSISGDYLPEAIRLQIVGSMCMAMLVTTAIFSVQACVSRFEPMELVLVSSFLGWMAGAIMNALIAPALGAQHPEMLVSAMVTAAMLVVFLFQTARTLEKCNPDSFIALVATMDSTLFLIVPVRIEWAFALCLLTSGCLYMRSERAVEEVPQLPGQP